MAKVSKICDDDPYGQRYLFECPGCGCAHVFRVPPWSFDGNMDCPTVRASILVNKDLEKAAPGDFRCHSFITAGKIEFLGDSTHPLAGQTVEMTDI